MNINDEELNELIEQLSEKTERLNEIAELVEKCNDTSNFVDYSSLQNTLFEILDIAKSK